MTLKTLSPNDIENLKIQAGSGSDPVTISREDFDALVLNYEGYYLDRHGDLCRGDHRS